MSKLSKQRAKERFLKLVDAPEKDAIFDELNSNLGEEDLYTYFVQKDAFKSGVLEEKEINEFALKVYSDWYFLHKNTPNNNIKAVKLLSEYEFAPVNLTGDAPLELIKSGQFSDVLPIYFQYTNRLEDTYFIVIKTDELYNRKFKDIRFEVRLYLNLKIDRVLDFAKEFLDKAYLEEFPAILKVLNNDNRCDNVIIYTDYEYAEKVIDVIEAIKYEVPSIFKNCGVVSKLLGSINDYIGFGEQTRNGGTYFSTRCRALSSMQNKAGAELLTKGIVAEEKKLVFRTDGNSYTATEYLEYLISKNIVKVIESRIEELENAGEHNTDELDRLYNMREDVNIGVDVKEEVNKLKKSLTRNVDYTLELNGIGSDSYDYLSKLYRLFTSVDTRNLKVHSIDQKKDIVGEQLFKVTDTFEGVNTREFLDTYFKAKLSMVVKELLDKDLEDIKRSRQSEVLVNIKKKSCAKLKSILTSIVDDGDEGKEYIGRCIKDYVRILSTGALEIVEVSIDGRAVHIDADVNVDIINMLPALKEEVDKLSLDSVFVDNILLEFGINKDNICLGSTTKDIRKVKVKKEDKRSRYYYDPEGYLSKDIEK